MKESARIFRFAVIGTLNALIMAVTVWVMMDELDINYMLSNVTAYILAQIHNFIWCKYFLTIARLLMKKGDMNERVENEFLDQAITAFLSGSYHVRNAAMTAIRRFMQQNEENSFQVCRRVEGMDNSSSDVEQLLYNLVKEEVC